MEHIVDALSLFYMRKIEVHVTRVFLKLIEQVLVRAAEDSVDFMNLVELVVAGKEGEESEHFEDNAPHSPEVHLVAVVAIGEQTLGSAVPTR